MIYTFDEAVSFIRTALKLVKTADNSIHVVVLFKKIDFFLYVLGKHVEKGTSRFGVTVELIEATERAKRENRV